MAEILTDDEQQKFARWCREKARSVEALAKQLKAKGQPLMDCVADRFAFTRVAEVLESIETIVIED